MQTSYSTPGGEGWYDSGTSAQASIKEGEIPEEEGIKHAFTSWLGDASGTGLTSNNIVMTGPKAATASWKTQFHLTVESEPPSINNLNGAGWYDAGIQATFSAPSIVPADQDSRLRFTQWTGAYNSNSAAGSVLMDSPKSVKAHYITQYFLSIQYDPASISNSYNESHASWYDANTNVQLGPAPITIQLSNVERLKFRGWSDNGSSLSSVSITVFVDKVHKVVLSYNTQYYVEVRSTYGVVSGTGWYDKGSTANIAASSSSGSWPIKYNLAGWHVDPSSGRLTKTDDGWGLTVDRPYVVEAVWNVDYIPIIVLLGGGGGAIILLSAGVVLAYRCGMFGRGGQALESPKPKSKRPPRIPASSIQVCSSCGYRATDNPTFCPKCGAPLKGAAVPAVSTSLEDKVYEYIVKNEGVISMSKASKDLGISVSELRQMTESLKKKGRIA